MLKRDLIMVQIEELGKLIAQVIFPVITMRPGKTRN